MALHAMDTASLDMSGGLRDRLGTASSPPIARPAGGESTRIERCAPVAERPSRHESPLNKSRTVAGGMQNHPRCQFGSIIRS